LSEPSSFRCRRVQANNRRTGSAAADSRCQVGGLPARHHFLGAIALPRPNSRKEYCLQVFVRDNNVDQALRALKKKLQREGVFREMKRRRFYEKPSERTTREKGEAIRRARKLARKQAQREGLIAAPKKKEIKVVRAPPRF
jgi:small subunit ribosomal protein S21